MCNYIVCIWIPFIIYFDIDFRWIDNDGIARSTNKFATGFLGKNLMPVLSEKYEVFGVGSASDLRDQMTCHDLIDDYRPDVIVHAAGSVGGIGANQKNLNLL